MAVYVCTPFGLPHVWTRLRFGLRYIFWVYTPVTVAVWLRSAHSVHVWLVLTRSGSLHVYLHLLISGSFRLFTTVATHTVYTVGSLNYPAHHTHTRFAAHVYTFGYGCLHSRLLGWLRVGSRLFTFWLHTFVIWLVGCYMHVYTLPTRSHALLRLHLLITRTHTVGWLVCSTVVGLRLPGNGCLGSFALRSGLVVMKPLHRFTRLHTRSAAFSRYTPFFAARTRHLT